MSLRPVVLAIGGLDPSGGAGLLADAEAITAAGGRALVVATALTFQSTTRALGFHAVPVEQLRRQLEPLLQDEPIGAVKLGMLATGEAARFLAELHGGPLGRVPWVLDPVLAASAGLPLIDDASAYDALLPLVSLVTPNAPEAARLAGLPAAQGLEELLAAGHALRARGATAVLLKGGHLAGDATDRLLTEGGWKGGHLAGDATDPLLTEGGWKGGHLAGDATDRLLTEVGLQSFTAPRLPGTRRGTGCRLAAAIATGLARGLTLPEAIEAARAIVRRYLAEGQCR